MVLVPALLMVSTIRFRSFKTIDLQARRPLPRPDLLRRAASSLIAHASAERARRDLAYGYLASALHRTMTRAASADAARSRLEASAGRRAALEPRQRQSRTRRARAPFSLVTAIVPPFSSTLRFAIVRPRPVPVALVEKYGSKIVRQRLGVHADAGVGDLDRRRAVGRRAAVAERQRAAARHRVQRVLDDVGQRAREQRAIDRQHGGRSGGASTSMRDAVRRGRRGTARRPRRSAPAARVGAGRGVGRRGEARELARRSAAAA